MSSWANQRVTSGPPCARPRSSPPRHPSSPRSTSSIMGRRRVRAGGGLTGSSRSLSLARVPRRASVAGHQWVPRALAAPTRHPGPAAATAAAATAASGTTACAATTTHGPKLVAISVAAVQHNHAAQCAAAVWLKAACRGARQRRRQRQLAERRPRGQLLCWLQLYFRRGRRGGGERGGGGRGGRCGDGGGEWCWWRRAARRRQCRTLPDFA